MTIGAILSKPNLLKTCDGYSLENNVITLKVNILTYISSLGRNFLSHLILIGVVSSRPFYPNPNTKIVNPR